jgi:hypothetical protein
MTTEQWYESLEQQLRALTVHDVSVECDERTRDECLAVLAARRTGPSAESRGTTWPARAEPLVAIAIGVVYLAAAVRASMVLLGR